MMFQYLVMQAESIGISISLTFICYIQGHSICSNLTKLVMRFPLNGLTKNGGRVFMLQQWPPLGVDGEL